MLPPPLQKHFPSVTFSPSHQAGVFVSSPFWTLVNVHPSSQNSCRDRKTMSDRTAQLHKEILSQKKWLHDLLWILVSMKKAEAGRELTHWVYPLLLFLWLPLCEQSRLLCLETSSSCLHCLNRDPYSNGFQIDPGAQPFEPISFLQTCSCSCVSPYEANTESLAECSSDRHPQTWAVLNHQVWEWIGYKVEKTNIYKRHLFLIIKMSNMSFKNARGKKRLT